MPAPPARVSATKATRHSSASTPVWAARPLLTPPSIRSVRLRCSGGGGVESEPGSGVDVMTRACAPRGVRHIGERPDPSLVPHLRGSPDAHAVLELIIGERLLDTPMRSAPRR